MRLRASILLLLIMVIIPSIRAQPLYGNEWIHYNQKYVRIPIVRTGFYNLTFLQLSKLGIDIDSLADTRFQLFRNGRQVPIKLDYAENSTHSSITFYAEQNNGSTDTPLYVSPDLRPPSFYNLYSDTASYYLTWNATLDSKPIPTKINRIHESNPTSIYIAEELQLLHGFYAPGRFFPPGSNFQTGLVLSSYDIGEGWTGPVLSTQNPGFFKLKLEEVAASHISECQTEIYLQGRDAGNHQVEIWAAKDGKRYRKIATSSILDYNSLTLKVHFLPDDIQSDQTLSFQVIPIDPKAILSVSAIHWKYPRIFKPETQSLQKSFAWDTTYIGKTWNKLSDASHDLYDCTDPWEIVKIGLTQGGFLIDRPSKLVEVKSYYTPKNLQLLHFSRIDPAEVDYLIISHPALRTHANDPIQAYAHYRASHDGGGYKPLILHSQDIYDQFNYGQPGPQGIRNAIRWLFEKGNLKFVLLIGTSIDPQRNRRQPNNLDMVPNGGWPGSDLALAMPVGLTAPDFIPLVPVGRIHAQHPDQVWTYLQKVVAMESAPSTARWRKNILHLSGGINASEQALFKNYTQLFASNIKETSLAPHITTISKKQDDLIEQIPINKYLQDGLALITLFGHSSLESTDLQIGYASDSLHIAPHYPYFPAVIVNGCATGSIFYSNTTLSADWIFAPRSGAVLFLAHTFNGSSSHLRRYTESIYQVLADPHFHSKPFGIIQQEAIKRNLGRRFSVGDAIHAQQMNLQGDPAIRIFPATQPDYSFDTTYFKQIRPSRAHTDSISFEVVVQNFGRTHTDDTVSLLLNRTVRGQLIQSHRFNCPKVSYADTLLLRVARQQLTPHAEHWEFILDPENALLEEREDNNLFQVELAPFILEATPILPLNRSYESTFPLALVAQIPSERTGETLYFEWADNPLFTASLKLPLHAQATIVQTLIDQIDADTLFWRVYLEKDGAARAEKRIIFISDQAPIPALPEVVILESKLLKNTFLEGEAFHPIVQFQNITPVSFTDSIQIQIHHHFNNLETTNEEWIKPLVGYERRIYERLIPTLGQVGMHEFKIIFNHSQLPEQIYVNNQYHVTFQVSKDRVAPALFVLIDGKPRLDFEQVSAQPQIEILLQDENRFQIRTDTTDVHLYLQKLCEGCSSVRISLQNATYTSDDSNLFRLHVPIDPPLEEGTYVMTVKAKDLSQNPAKTHKSRFQVSSVPQVQMLVSPNPARNWIRFQIDVQGKASGTGVIQIWNQKGQPIQTLRNDLGIGRNEVFWYPLAQPAGIYLYQLTWLPPHDQYQPSPLQGKIIWIP
jgi:hypothetical protein